MAIYTIYPIPYEIHGPPYLDLLYGQTKGRDEEGSEFCTDHFSWKKLLFGKREGRQIVHIHWPTNIYGSEYVLVSIVRGSIRFAGLWLLRFRGVKILWTMHNMHGHDYPHPWIDNLGQTLMYHTANRVIIQEKTFAASETARRETDHIVCVPPGNYIGAYGPLWQGDRDVLRKRFGIKKEEVVLLSIGSIRPYKDLLSVIDAVNEACKDNKKLRLVIAGKANQEYAREVDAHISESSAITMYSEYIPDEKIPEFLALADYTVCYYTDSALGSAAIMLSLSYGVPVITRDFPASELVIEGRGGYLFHDKEELTDILRTLHLFPGKPDDIIDTIRKQNWQNAGKKLRRACKALWL